jgi:carbamoylphosphate synthase small subunit
VSCSHWNAQQSLGDWLKAHKVPAIHSIDTRALIKKIRETGSMLAKIVLDGDDEQAVELEDPNQRHLVAEVSRKQPQIYGSGSINVVAVDCGMKNNQVRCFLKRGVKVKVVPWDWPLLEEKDAHGFFLSNGTQRPIFIMHHQFFILLTICVVSCACRVRVVSCRAIITVDMIQVLAIPPSARRPSRT